MHLDKMSYRETFDNKIHKYIFSGICNCGGQKEITVNGPDLFRFRQGTLIQDAFPYLSADEREFLITGICNTCWEASFGDDDND